MFLFILSFLFVQGDIPYKANDTFELKMDYQFKQRATDNTKAVDYAPQRQKSTGPLPYLGVELKVLKYGEGETRVRVTDFKDGTVINKKVKSDQESFKLDLGFTDDMKDRVSSYQYTVYFIDDKSKQPVSKIVIYVAEDGAFIVNGEKRGKL